MLTLHYVSRAMLNMKCACKSYKMQKIVVSIESQSQWNLDVTLFTQRYKHACKMIMPMHIDNIKQVTVKRKVGDKKDVNFHFMRSHLSLLCKLSRIKFCHFCWYTSDREGHVCTRNQAGHTNVFTKVKYSIHHYSFEWHVTFRNWLIWLHWYH